MQHWAFHVALALDQLVNALLGGYADESLSARAYRRRSEGLWGLLVMVLDWMFFWHTSHCESAYRAEKLGRHLPPEYRNG
jgi:hypothetical protein